ncbi:MAG: sugar-binding protein [Candidatus Hinthialibacter antarcticus]|nr:sugar-binding protein [Candidatus Hinthialibacter antarcticus]
MRFKNFFVLSAAVCLLMPVHAQTVDEMVDAFLSFDMTAEGPWSDVDLTTTTVPKVGNGSITLDGSISSGEYGGYEGTEIVPGKNAWILDFASAKEWEGPDDNSFTFYLAYDDDNLYLGVSVKDDVVRSNDPPAAFWKDDAIEIVMDPSNSRYDYNTDSVNNLYGGHCYFNWEGLISAFDYDTGLPFNAGTEEAPTFRWGGASEWTYAEDGDIYGIGIETADGWAVEVRIGKATLEDTEAGVTLTPGTTMAFNLGVDDDDGADLAIQYFWASRVRAIGATPDDENWDLLLEEEIANKDYLDPDSLAAFWEVGINETGRLSRAGGGEIILGESTEINDWQLQ